MKLADKDLMYYWDIVKFPVYIIIAWNLAATITQLFISTSLYMSIFGNKWAGWLISLAFYSFIGFSAVSDHKSTAKQAGWAGAVGGVITGVVGAVLGIIAFLAGSPVIEMSINQAIAQGVPEATIRTMVSIGVYAGVIIGPVIGGAIGWVIAAVAGALTKKAN